MSTYEEFIHAMYYDTLMECLLLLPYYISDETLESHVYPFFYDTSSEYSQKTLVQIVEHYMKKNKQAFYKYYISTLKVDAMYTKTIEHQHPYDKDEETMKECSEEVLNHLRNKFFTLSNHWEEIIKDLYLLQPYYQSYRSYFDCIQYDICNSFRTSRPYFKISLDNESRCLHLNIIVTENATNAGNCQIYMVCEDDDDDQNDSVENCMICMENIQKKDSLQYSCTHKLCVNCCCAHFDNEMENQIENCDKNEIKISHYCPYCRQPVNSIFVYSVESFNKMDVFDTWKPLQIKIQNHLLMEYCWKMVHSEYLKI